MLSTDDIKLIFLESVLVVISIYFCLFFLTDVLDDYRIEDVESQLRESRLEHDSSVLSEEFSQAFGNSTCTLRKQEIMQEFNGLEGVGEEINRYTLRGLGRNLEPYSVVRRSYFLTQLELLNSVYTYNDRCDDEIFPVIQFVDAESDTMDRQGLILEQFYTTRDDVIVVVFDISFDDEEIVNELRDYYSVEETPFIVAGNKTSRNLTESGRVSLETLENEYERVMS